LILNQVPTTILYLVGNSPTGWTPVANPHISKSPAMSNQLIHSIKLPKLSCVLSE
jgi:hypothetical protein